MIPIYVLFFFIMGIAASSASDEKLIDIMGNIEETVNTCDGFFGIQAEVEEKDVLKLHTTPSGLFKTEYIIKLGLLSKIEGGFGFRFVCKLAGCINVNTYKINDIFRMTYSNSVNETIRQTSHTFVFCSDASQNENLLELFNEAMNIVNNK